MKITIETEYVIATVESKPGFHRDDEISEAIELIENALLGVGFLPETIKRELHGQA